MPEAALLLWGLFALLFLASAGVLAYGLLRWYAQRTLRR